MVRPLRWFLIVVGLVIVLVGVVFWIAHRRAGETLETNAAIVSDLITKARARGGPRPTLGAPAAEGDAWPIYRAVLDQVSAISGRDDEISDWLDGYKGNAEPPTRAEFDAWYVRTHKIIDDLEPALSAPTLSVGLPYEEGMEGSTKWIPAWQSLSRIMTAHVKRHRERGEFDEALDLAVLRAFAAKDSMRDAGLIGSLVAGGVLRVSINEMQEMLAERTIAPARLDRLAAEVEILRADLPSNTEVWRTEQIYLRQALADPSAWEGELDRADRMTVAARYLFSTRLMAAEALEHLSAELETFEAAVAGKRGAAAEAASKARLDELQKVPNPLLHIIFAVHPMTVRRSSELRMHLDLLRITIGLARHRQAIGRWPESLQALVPRYLPTLPDCDYSGEPFRHRAGKVWSIGGDGDDDGGTPLGEDDDVTAEGDVVRSAHDPDAKQQPVGESAGK